MSKAPLSRALATAFMIAASTPALGSLDRTDIAPYRYDALQVPPPIEETAKEATKTYNEIAKICRKHSQHVYPIYRQETGKTFAMFRFINLPKGIECAGEHEEVFLSRHDIKLILNKIKHKDKAENDLAVESLKYFKDHIGRGALLKADRELNDFACTPKERIKMHFSFRPTRKACPANDM